MNNEYIKPSIEVIVLELEGTMANSFTDNVDNGRQVDGGANAKRRNLWDE